MIKGSNHIAVDNFLSTELRDRLLQYALDHRHLFSQSAVIYENNLGRVKTDVRNSWTCQAGLGPLHKPFKEYIKSSSAALISGLGISGFEVAETEVELVAHRDGCYFRPHIDTTTGSIRNQLKSDRVLSMVYYFHSHPKGFSGGELVMAPLVKGEPQIIEPKDNRLIAFPSFLPHEVKPVACPGDNFADARFAVSCWLHRARNAPH
jgi:SM-20-related protein